MKVNPDGTVVSVRQWYQLSEGEQRLCGPASAVIANNAAPPGESPTATPEDIDTETDDVVQSVFHTTPADFAGVNDQDMFNLLIYLRDKYQRIHFQVVSSMSELDVAVLSGYPCLFSCNEKDLAAWNKTKLAWEHPYPWTISAGHVLCLVGIEAGTGNWIVADPLNNSFQGYWPVIYSRPVIAKSFSWGAIVQLTKFLLPIPPLDAWPAGFDAQIGVPAQSNLFQRKAWEKEVNSLASSPLAITTGIMQSAWLEYQTGRGKGPALTTEFPSTDWDGKPIVVQVFAGGRCEWQNGVAHWYPWR